MSATEERLVDLEIKVSYQERLLAELDSVVRQLATQLNNAERELGDLRNFVREAATDGSDIGPADEKPPHY